MTDRLGAMLITGGSRGIGRAAALAAAKAGWDVAMTYRTGQAAAEEVAQAVRAEGRKAVALRCDVLSEAEIVAAFDGAEAALGRLAAVVVNAGIVAPSLKLAEMSAERIARVIGTNVTGALLTAREAARRLAPPEDRSASLIFISSVAARLGSPGEYVDYAASKGAIDTAVIGLSRELAPLRIRVNGIRPGLIETDIHASGGEPDRAWRLAPMVPMQRPGTAAEVAEAVTWLASPAASYVTGALLDVSGGR